MVFEHVICAIGSRYKFLQGHISSLFNFQPTHSISNVVFLTWYEVPSNFKISKLIEYYRIYLRTLCSAYVFYKILTKNLKFFCRILWSIWVKSKIWGYFRANFILFVRLVNKLWKLRSWCKFFKSIMVTKVTWGWKKNKITWSTYRFFFFESRRLTSFETFDFWPTRSALSNEWKINFIF